MRTVVNINFRDTVYAALASDPDVKSGKHTVVGSGGKGFEENKHPRAANGKFGPGAHGTHAKAAAHHAEAAVKHRKAGNHAEAAKSAALAAKHVAAAKKEKKAPKGHGGSGHIVNAVNAYTAAVEHTGAAAQKGP